MRDGLEMIKKEEQVSEPPSTNTYEDDEIEPLSGNPFFHIVLCKTHVDNPYQLSVPVEGTHLLPQKTVLVTLTRGKRSWEMTYNGTHPTHKRFDCSMWKVFVVDNMLKVGDVCIFELMTCSATTKFKVQVLRGDFPSVLLDKKDGTSDNPILLE